EGRYCAPMILDRLYVPTGDELIYHYCRPEAFLEIIRSRCLWLSAYYVLSDLTEGRWGYSVFQKVAEQLQKEAGKDFIDRVGAIITSAYLRSVMMISSHSLDADVLSQWILYADHGQGFAIGFLPELMQMLAKQLRVLYDEEAQITELRG